MTPALRTFLMRREALLAELARVEAGIAREAPAAPRPARAGWWIGPAAVLGAALWIAPLWWLL